MKQFFKFMFASMLGFMITFIFAIILLFGLISSLISLSEKEVVTVDANSILYIDITQVLSDRTSNNPFNTMDFLSLKPHKFLGLNDILKNLRKAKEDPNIEGIYLELSNLSAGLSTLGEIRIALLDFKESGKFIISYSEYMSQGAYYIASTADKIYHNPQGIFLFKGLSAQVMYYKGLLDKLEVEAQVIRHGDFKSAVEPYLLDQMSEANRKQTSRYINNVWEVMLRQIAISRETTVEALNEAADKLIIQNLDDAVKYKLIDKLIYKDEVLQELRKLLAIGSKDPINSISLAKYNNTPGLKTIKGRDKIAVIYANGSIIGGNGNDQNIGSARISKAIRKARTDKRVKAIVFRVNSGGGDVVASEVIRREISLAVKMKPVIASFGDYAASGGYWISCEATKIFASPLTLTGSIGVFAILPNIQGLLNNKLGITFDQVNTNKYSDFYTGTKALSSYEKAVLTKNIENTYDTFLELVAEGRHMDKKEVNKIAGGRIWSGEDAKRIGLIDEFGGLTEAINEAIKLAEVENYRIIELPVQKDPWQQLIEDWTSNAKASAIEQEFGSVTKYLKPLKALTEMKGIQARLPFELIIE